MIKVNLLSSGSRGGAQGAGASSGPVESSDEEKEIQKQGALKLFIILLPAVGLFLYESQHIPTLNGEKAQLQRTLVELKSYNSKTEAGFREIKRFKEDQARIQQRIEALQKLSKSRTNEIKILKLLADVIPERAWLTSVSVRDGRANIVGLAVANADVSNFVEKLKSNILVADLQLVRINEERIENGPPLTRFEFMCVLEGRK
jgi:type IV pilus assembly protein PilN